MCTYTCYRTHAIKFLRAAGTDLQSRKIDVSSEESGPIVFLVIVPVLCLDRQIVFRLST
jgi:hypothetical protein